MSARRSGLADRQLLPADAEPAPRTAAMVEASASLRMLVQSEVEALQLEYNLIKQHRPRYNVRYRDDKSYPWLAVPLADEIPRPRVERGPKRKGTKYFGPYAHAYAIRETLISLRTFPMRTCSRGVRPAPAPAGPASCSTSTSAPDPASARSPRRAPADRRGLRDLHGRAHPADPAAAGGRDAPGRRGAQLRAGGLAARPVGQRPQGHGTPAGKLRPGGLRMLPSPRTTWKRPSRCSSSAGAG